MVQIVQELVEDNKVSLKSNFLAAAMAKAPCLSSKFDREKIPTKVGKYLYDIAQVWDAMDYDADERLLRQSFVETKQDVVTVGPRGSKWEPPLHIRRTLDQSYFSIVEDTVDRDTDQVVYRQTRARKENHETQHKDEKAATSSTSLNTTSPHTQHVESTAVSRTLVTGPGSTTTSSDTATKKKKEKMTKLVGVTRVVMVDQLWMWILGEGKTIPNTWWLGCFRQSNMIVDTIITSFPRRWGRNKPDSSGVHKSLRQILGKRKRIRSIYHLGK